MEVLSECKGPHWRERGGTRWRLQRRGKLLSAVKRLGRKQEAREVVGESASHGLFLFHAGEVSFRPKVCTKRKVNLPRCRRGTFSLGRAAYLNLGLGGPNDVNAWIVGFGADLELTDSSSSGEFDLARLVGDADLESILL